MGGHSSSLYLKRTVRTFVLKKQTNKQAKKQKTFAQFPQAKSITLTNYNEYATFVMMSSSVEWPKKPAKPTRAISRRAGWITFEHR